MTRHTLHVETDDPDALTEGIKAFERLGCRVSCPAYDARERLRERDEHLRRAGELMSAGSTWAKACALAREINTFESILWPRWHDLPSPPEACSQLRRHLFEAHKVGELPSSDRWLYDILKRDGAGAFSAEHG